MLNFLIIPQYSKLVYTNTVFYRAVELGGFEDILEIFF